MIWLEVEGAATFVSLQAVAVGLQRLAAAMGIVGLTGVQHELEAIGLDQLPGILASMSGAVNININIIMQLRSDGYRIVTGLLDGRLDRPREAAEAR